MMDILYDVVELLISCYSANIVFNQFGILMITANEIRSTLIIIITISIDDIKVLRVHKERNIKHNVR